MKLTGWRIGVCMIAAFLLASPAARAAENRYLLASQQDWGQHRGFYLDLENSGPDGAAIKLDSLRLILSVADGKTWRITTTRPAWEFGHDYHVKAVISTARTSLSLDGQEVGSSSGPLVADTGEFDAGLIPDWAGARAEYLIVQRSLTLTVDGAKSLQFDSPLRPDDLPRLLLAQETPLRTSSWHFDPTRTLTIDTTFTLVRRPNDLRAFAPFVDKYGQSRYGTWPGKITSDQQLIESTTTEKERLASMAPAVGIDTYGGDLHAGWHENATGFYHVVRKNGFWWLITPSGYPCFYTGISTAPATTWDRTPVTGRESLFAELPPRSGEFARAWGKNAWGERGDTDYVALHTINMIRKYGPQWETTARSVFTSRLHAWGFTGMGKWCEPVGDVPYVAVLGRAGIPAPGGKPDIFDAAVKLAMRRSLRLQMHAHLQDPYLVGWSLGNEFDEIVTHDTITTALHDTRVTAAKKALIDYAVDHLYGGDPLKLALAWHVTAYTSAELTLRRLDPIPTDLEQLRHYYADQYYGFLYESVKSIDPNHLYFGFWIVPDWWENESDWGLIAGHCDVIGYDRYSFEFADGAQQKRMRDTDKPVLCGEFSYPPQYDGDRGFGLYSVWTRTDQEAGERYARWIADAAQNPYCIGGCWFQYRDEPITGRGPGNGPDLAYGERYAFGLVDVTDRPKWDLVTSMRAANLKATRSRLDATRNPAGTRNSNAPGR